MNDLLAILYVIDRNGSVSRLVKMGYTYSQINKMISDCINIGLVKIENDILVLTDKGKEILLKEQGARKTGGPKTWILPQKQYHVTKKSKYDIVFPKRI